MGSAVNSIYLIRMRTQTKDLTTVIVCVGRMEEEKEVVGELKFSLGGLGKVGLNVAASARNEDEKD